MTQRQASDGSFPASWSPVGDQVVAGAPAAILDPVVGKVYLVARVAGGALYQTSEVAQGSPAWQPWTRISGQQGVDLPLSAVDPVLAPITNSRGSGWVIVYRTANDTPHLVERVMPLG